MFADIEFRLVAEYNRQCNLAFIAEHTGDECGSIVHLERMRAMAETLHIMGYVYIFSDEGAAPHQAKAVRQI